MDRRVAILGWLALAGLMLFARGLRAQGVATVPGEAVVSPSHVVFVPYDRMTGPEWGAGKSVLLPYAKFLELQNAADPADPARQQPVASLSQMDLVGKLMDTVVVFDGTLTLRVLAEADDALAVALPFDGASLESFAVEGAESLAAPSDAKGVLLLLRGPGDRTIRVRLAVPVSANAAERRIDFEVPRAAAASVRVAMTDPADLARNPDDLPASIERAEGAVATIVAAAGGRDRVRLSWRPRAEALEGQAVEARISATMSIFATVAAGRVDVRTQATAAILSGEVSSIGLVVPKGMRILNVSGPYVRGWDGPDAEGRVAVQLLRAASGDIPLSIEGQIDAADDARVAIPPLGVAGAVRESGSVTIIPEDSIDLWPEEVAGLQAVAAEQGAPAKAGVRSWRFGAPGWTLALSREPVKPTLRADSLVVYDVANEIVRLRTLHGVVVGGRGVFGMRIVVPEGYELLEAEPQDLVSGSRQEGTTVDLNFRTEQMQSFAVSLRLQRARSSVEEDVALLPVRIEGADEDIGSVVLAAPLALRPTEAKADGLQPADVRSMGESLPQMLAQDSVAVLGYRHVAPTFSGLVKIERRRTRTTCETSIMATAEPTLLRVDATLAWNVEFSATDEFQILVPSAAGEDVRIEGADIKEKTRASEARGDGMSLWTVRLQRRVLGPYRLSTSYDVPIAADDDGKPLAVDVPLVRAEGVARETGHVAISRGENLEVRVAKSEGLERRDVKELPAALAGAFLGFRYFDPEPTRLSIEMVRHDLETVLGALVRRLHIETVVNDQREAVHEVWLDVQNNREQYLELKLPKGMAIWSAFVAGAPVRPALRESDGAHLVEIAKSENASSAFRVRLILRETLPGGEFGWHGRLAFAPPQVLGIPILRTTWKTYLPREWRYTDFGGTMQAETGSGRPWLEPLAENMLANIPAGVAGGIAQPLRDPNVAGVAPFYEANETPDEQKARAGAAALDIPIVKEGAQFEFSRLSGLGTVEVSYWSRKALLAMQGSFALVLLALLVAAAGVSRRPAVPVVALLASFVAASLLGGLAGHFAATAMAASALACAVALAGIMAARIREARAEARAAAEASLRAAVAPVAEFSAAPKPVVRNMEESGDLKPPPPLDDTNPFADDSDTKNER